MIVYEIIRNQIEWEDYDGWVVGVRLNSEFETDALYLRKEDAEKDILSWGYVERTWSICPPDKFYNPKYDGPKTAVVTGYVKLYPWEPNGFDHDFYYTIEEVEIHETATCE